MKRAIKGNRSCLIQDYDAERYLADGYNIYEESGELVNKAIPRDYNALKLEYNKALEEIDKLKKEIETLKSAKPAKAVATETTPKQTTKKKNIEE